MNLVPKSGGNTFAGTAFFNVAGEWSRGNNLDDSLRAIGLTETPGIIQAYDASGSFGGPIKRNRLWFFGSYRNLDTQNALEGINANANTGDASRWDWIGSPIPARLVQDRQMIIGRVTGQLEKAASRSTPDRPASLRGNTAQRRHQRGATTAALTGSASATTRRRSRVARGDVDGCARLLRRAVLPESTVLDDGRQQQAAPGSGLHRVPLQPHLRPSAARRHHQPAIR